jgi:hypothetical protein
MALITVHATPEEERALAKHLAVGENVIGLEFETGHFAIRKACGEVRYIDPKVITPSLLKKALGFFGL